MKAFALLTTLLVGCVSTREIVLPDGTRGFAIECRNTVAICYQRASKACPTGYDFLDSEKNELSSAAIVGQVGSAESKMYITKIIRCKSASPVSH